QNLKVSEVIKNIVFLMKNKLNIANSHNSQRLWFVRKEYIKRLPKNYDVAIGYLQSSPVYYVVDKVTANKKIAWFHSDYIAGSYNKNIDYPYFKKVDKIVTVSEKSCRILQNVFHEIPGKIEIIKNIVSKSYIKELANND